MLRTRLSTGQSLAVVVALSMMASACGSDDAAEPTGTATGATTATSGDSTDGAGPLFIYITPTPIGVNQFLQLGKDGTERAAQAAGGTAKTFESSDASTQRSNIEAAIEEEPDIIVLTTFSFNELAAEFGAANPDQQFVFIDSCTAEPLPNVFCGGFREQEGAYLLGVEAGMLTKTNKVGTVASLDTPFLHRWSDSFALGANSIAEIEDTQLFVAGENPFADPVRAKEQALAMASQGTDQILAAAASGSLGVFEAATEEGFLAYGVDVNQCGDAPGSVVDNNLKRVDVVTESLIGQVMDGTAAQFVSFGLAEDGVSVIALSDDVANSGCVIADHPDIIKAVKEAAAGIIDGTMVVPDPLAAG